MPEVLVVEECDSLEGMCSVSVELSGCEGVPKRWFRLVRLEDGVATAATEADAESLGALLTPQTARAARSPALSVEEAPDSPEAERAQTTSRHTAPTKPGGPCDHCSTLESPQWRRGPAAKPVLCNACGTRYRRTGVLLASSLPSPFPCASPRPAKKPRIVMDELHGLMVKC